MTGPIRPPNAPAGPRGFVGATGPQGPTGASGGVPAKEVYYPSREGKSVSLVAVGEDFVELRALAYTSVGGGTVSLSASIIMCLVRDGRQKYLNTWGIRGVLEKDAEALASSAAAFLLSAEVVLGQEELNAMFVVARREALKMAAVVASELFISHLSREELAEAWDAANVLRVMQE